MRLLCLGDVALAEETLLKMQWPAPGGMDPGQDDRIMFNWELPIGEQINPNPRTSGERILARPGSPCILQQWAPGFAALATNHILDGGVTGLDETIRSLGQAGFTTLGAGLTQDEMTRPILWETGEGCLAVLNWVFKETNPDWMTVPGPNCWPGLDEARTTIQALKQQVDWVMLFIHWSDELFSFPHAEDRRLAEELAKAGADIIVGHHPHVVRGMETFDGCPVFYSLGNFYFSDIRSARGGWVARAAPRNREALGVQITFRHNQKPQVQALSFWQSGGETTADPKNRAERRMRQAAGPLKKYQGSDYARWYARSRARFDKLDYRVHFRVWQLGVDGLVRYFTRR